ncbi:hypothetical protein LIER_16828 [Lithospermum erythrorhizon]|uniref:Aminotransferase-like plant mobile domain-containing protein n=1 Tax=Lithospermum erythrorhizon TaxID=34254 RepID=A0AAV3QDI4_LITER
MVTASSDRSVSPKEWISFWSTLPRGYAGPPAAESGRADSSFLPCYPRGSITADGSRSTTNLGVFKSLKVPSSLVDETVSLAIPVQPSIYRGLHLITTACYLSNSGRCFPVHYLLGWIGTYLHVYSPMKKYPPSPHMVRRHGLLLSLLTNMVGYREDAFFLLKAYNPHRFSKLGQSVTFPSASSIGGLARVSQPGWIVCFFVENLKSAPLGPEVADSGDEAQEIMDSTGPSECMITEKVVTGSQGNGAQTEVMDLEEPSDCLITKAAVAAVPVASSSTSVHRIESILRDSLRAAWSELCSFVESKSQEDLLAEEGGIMASFEALTEFIRQDLSSQGEELKVVFSAARDIRGARCSVIPSEVHDRLTAIQTALAESSSKLKHKTKAIGSVRTTLQQSEEKVARLRHELADLDTHLEDLRRQVAVRESVITGLESEHAGFALEVASLEESIERGCESRGEQLGVEPTSLRICIFAYPDLFLFKSPLLLRVDVGPELCFEALETYWGSFDLWQAALIPQGLLIDVQLYPLVRIPFEYFGDPTAASRIGFSVIFP